MENEELRERALKFLDHRLTGAEAVIAVSVMADFAAKEIERSAAEVERRQEMTADRWHDVLKLAHNIRQGSVVYTIGDIERVAREALTAAEDEQ